MSEIVDRLREHAMLIVETHEYAAITMRDAADEIERLQAALASSCEENRSVALAEPGRTATCPLEQELRREVERLRAESAELKRGKEYAEWMNVPCACIASIGPRSEDCWTRRCKRCERLQELMAVRAERGGK